MNTAHCIRFHLALPAGDYLAHYRQFAHEILVRAEDGRDVKFPANRLRRFVSREGVYGVFEIRFDDEDRFISLRRVSD